MPGMLTDTEKRAAFLQAILDGRQVEPFATWAEYEDAMLETMSVIDQAFSEWFREQCARGETW